MPKIECFDLFGGIGGFRHGLSVADPDFKFTHYADINKYACAVYNYNFSEAWEPTDIRSVRADDIPDHRLLCCGFPCHSWSRAGNERGFCDPRGQLFFEVERIIRVKQPEYVFLENVAGLLSNDRGRSFARVLDTLRDCGYVGSWCCINSAAFLPQARKRVYIVGRLGDEPSRVVLPFAEGDGRAYPTCESTQGEGKRLWGYPANTLQSRDGKGGAMQYIAHPCLTPTRAEKRQLGRRFKGCGEPMFTLTASDIHGALVVRGDEEYRIRQLTPLEYDRLQGFPDDWSKFGKFQDDVKEISRSRRYQLLGNAVTIPVIAAIGREIVKEMRSPG